MASPSTQRSGSSGPVLAKALVLSVGLLVALFQYLMGQLRIQAIEMEHMDPADIVLVPFELHRLAVYVVSVTLVSAVLHIAVHGSSAAIPQLLGHCVQATVAFWVIAVVCGTPPTLHVPHTGWASVYLATLTVLLPEAPSTTTTTTTTWWQARLALPTPNSDLFHAQLVATCQIHGTLFLAVPLQVLRLYDWGSQIQRWPLPILLGGTYGFVAGSLVGGLLVMALQYSPSLRGWYDRWTIAQKMSSGTHQD